MNKNNDGGSAFPGISDDKEHIGFIKREVGMSLRDYFAGQALMRWSFEKEIDFEYIAKKSYELAEAMIKERLEATGE